MVPDLSKSETKNSLPTHGAYYIDYKGHINYYVAEYVNIGTIITSQGNIIFYSRYSITSLVRASVVRGPSVVRGFEWQNFSSQ